MNTLSVQKKIKQQQNKHTQKCVQSSLTLFYTVRKRARRERLLTFAYCVCKDTQSKHAKPAATVRAALLLLLLLSGTSLTWGCSHKQQWGLSVTECVFVCGYD